MRSEMQKLRFYLGRQSFVMVSCTLWNCVNETTQQHIATYVAASTAIVAKLQSLSVMWIQEENSKKYQVRAAILHRGTLFWDPWVTIQDGNFPMATLSVIKSGQQNYTMLHFWGP